ncbi:MAG: ankyrin repeat domain-containing protein [Acholeplasmatales bacterium]
MDVFIKARDNDLDFFYKNPIFLDMQDEIGQSLLHYAIRGNASDVFFYLLDNNINPNLKNLRGETPIFEAIRKGKIDFVASLIKSYAEVNVKNTLGEAPLHLACQKGSIKLISLLIENKADIFALNNKGESIIFYALKSHKIEAYDYVRLLSPEIKLRDYKDNTLLHVASTMGSLIMVEHLFKLKENPHLKNNLKETPIFEAVKKGNTHLLNIFVTYGSYVDLKNKYGETLMDIAIRNDFEEVVDFLTSHQESSLYVKNIEKNPLRHAVVKTDFDKVRYLKYLGTSDIKDEYLLYAYDYARRDQNKEILLLLD